jgi:hypothetical protein
LQILRATTAKSTHIEDKFNVETESDLEDPRAVFGKRGIFDKGHFVASKCPRNTSRIIAINNFDNL